MLKLKKESLSHECQPLSAFLAINPSKINIRYDIAV
jgi:hypothetical protein